ncbi:hypothetical protein QEG73_12160 [Chitinophagaceae bacterium 26-R-25]|nr:hypothetical protein [Chitinophagaceae bacterium 26-R-25]
MTKSFVTLSVLFALAIYSSCKKSTQNYLDGTYKTGEIVQLDSPKMYTKTSVITDAQLINSFLDRHKSPSLGRDTGFIFDQTTQVYNPKREFTLSGNTATTTEYGKLVVIQKNAEELVLEPADTISYMYSTDRLSSMNYWLEANNTGGYIYDSTKQSDALFYWVKTKDHRTLLQSNGKLYMPIVKFLADLKKSSEGVAIAGRGTNYWRYFNKNIAEHFVPGDTIIVQCKTAELIKQ